MRWSSATRESRFSPASVNAVAKVTKCCSTCVTPACSSARCSSTAQMNEPPGARWRVPLTALTIAEYFRDERHQNVLLPDGQRVPLRPGGIRGLRSARPAAVARRVPADAGERSARRCRNASSPSAVAVTAIEAVYVPADDFTDPAVTTIAAHVDSMVVLSRSMAAEGMYPAVDPIASSSILLDPLVVGEEHAAVATEVRRTIEHYRELQDVISLLGIEELGAEDRQIVERARRLQRFLTQPFAVHRSLHRRCRAARSPSATRLPDARRSWPVNATPGRRARFTWLARSMRPARRRMPPVTPARPNPQPAKETKANGGSEAKGAAGKASRCQPMSTAFHLTITTPAVVLVDRDDVASVRAEDASGSFGILPSHADLLTMLTPSVVRWRTVAGHSGFCAVKGGVLTVSQGTACSKSPAAKESSTIRCRHWRRRSASSALEQAEVDRRDTCGASPAAYAGGAPARAVSASGSGGRNPRAEHDR